MTTTPPPPPPRAARLIKDRRGHWRRIEVTLIKQKPRGVDWHYEARVIPSRSGRCYRGDDGEPAQDFMSRIEVRLQRWLSGW